MTESFFGLGIKAGRSLTESDTLRRIKTSSLRFFEWEWKICSMRIPTFRRSSADTTQDLPGVRMAKRVLADAIPLSQLRILESHLAGWLKSRFLPRSCCLQQPSMGPILVGRGAGFRSDDRWPRQTSCRMCADGLFAGSSKSGARNQRL